MIDHTAPQQSPPLTAIHDPRSGGRGYVHPIGRGVGPLGVTGRRGFLVLLVSGVVINAWALFPSAVESGVYIALPPGPSPAAAQADPVRDATGDLSAPTSRLRFRLMDTGRLAAVSASYGSVGQTDAARAVAMVPLRSKLQALLMLLYSRYGDGVDVAALELKLRELLDMPDSLLAQLIRHPDLVELAALLDAVFLDAAALSGISAELDKIDIVSTTGPTEQIDVITIGGKQAYVVYTPAVQPAVENIAVAAASVLEQRPAEFAVVVQVEASAEMAALAMAPVAETPVPVPEQIDPIVAEFIAPPDPDPVATEATSFPDTEELGEPTRSPQPEFEDAVDPDDPFEPPERDESFIPAGGGDTDSDPGDAPVAATDDAEAGDAPASAHEEKEGSSSSAEPSP